MLGHATGLPLGRRTGLRHWATSPGCRWGATGLQTAPPIAELPLPVWCLWAATLGQVTGLPFIEKDDKDMLMPHHRLHA